LGSRSCSWHCSTRAALVAFGGLALLAVVVLLNHAWPAALAAIAMFVEDSAASLRVGAIPVRHGGGEISPFIGVVLIALAATILAARRRRSGCARRGRSWSR
jgi:hypothetical protein